MARLSLIICDLCKKQIEEGGGAYTVAISFILPVNVKDLMEDESLPEKGSYDGETCKECFETLRNWLLAPTDAALEKPHKSLSDGLHKMVAQDVETHQDQPEAAVKSLEPPRPLNDRGKIEEGELNIVKSRFDKQKASAIIKTNKGSCAHHFKSYDSGKIVCGAAPPGYTGEFANFKGCGKTLTDAEF